MTITAELYELIVRVVEDKVRDIRVTREEFSKLTLEVSSLAEALNSLTKRVDSLAEAQKRTEERVGSLAEALGTLTKRVDLLAEAQKRTEEALTHLARSVGALSDTVGFGIEDVAKTVVPGWLERHEGIFVQDLARRFFVVDGEEVEVNLYGDGVRVGQTLVVVGEVKARFYGGDVEDFVGKVTKLGKVFKDKTVYKLIFGYWIHPSAEKVCRDNGITPIASYMR